MLKKIILGIIVITIIFIGVYSFFNKKDKSSVYTSEKIKIGKIIQTVSETGTVISQDDIDLSFEMSGKIKEKLIKIGAKVKKGDVLAKLDYSDLEIQKNDAENNLEFAKIEYNKLLSGARNEDIAISEASMKQAQASYDFAKKELEKILAVIAENKLQAQKDIDDLKSKTSEDQTALEQAFVVAQNNLDNAKSIYGKNINNSKNSAILAFNDKIALVNIALDEIDQIINEDDYDSYLSVKNLALKNNAKLKYDRALKKIKEMEIEQRSLNEDYSNNDILKIIDDLLWLLDETFDSLDYTYKALESSVSSNSFTDTTIKTLKSLMSTQQNIISVALSGVENLKQSLNTAILNYDTNVSTAQESLRQAEVNLSDAMQNAQNALINIEKNSDQQLINAQSKVDTAYKSLQVAKAQFNKVVANPDYHDIALAKTKIKQAENAIKSIENKIDDSIIYAPIDGVIVKDYYEVGEQVNLAVPVFSILGELGFEIEVLISESDISKVNIGDSTEITLDAFGDDIEFVGQVFFIEPAETEIQDVIYYKVKINFEVENMNVKSGMTANVIITTSTKEDVLLVPIRAIIDRDGDGKFLRVLTGDNQINERKVEIGLRGDGGMAEVLSGVDVGVDVVTYIKK